MSEVYSWLESQVYIFTGTATASARVAYAEDTNLTLQYGWSNQPSMSGVYRDHRTGQAATLSVGAWFSNDLTVARVFTSATAVHVHIRHANLYGSAGFFLYSGRFDSFTEQGSNGAIFKYSLAYHANYWSAYGGNA